jgi:hypothetical protein
MTIEVRRRHGRCTSWLCASTKGFVMSNILSPPPPSPEPLDSLDLDDVTGGCGRCGCGGIGGVAYSTRTGFGINPAFVLFAMALISQNGNSST